MGKFREGQWIILSLIFLVLSACSDSWEGRSPTEYDRAVALIDQGQYSTAIYILEGMIYQDEKNTQARILLASAYAGRAGIQFSQFIDVAQEITILSRQTNEFFEQNGILAIHKLKKQNSKNKKQYQALETIEKVYESIIRINNFIRAFSKVPEIQTRAQVLDLKKSIYHLDTLKKVEGGPAMYRGLLKIVLFKYQIKNEYNLESEIQCKVIVKNLNYKLAGIYESLKEILQDITLGTLSAKKRKNIQKLMKEIDTFYTDIHSTIEMLTIGNTINLKSVIKDLGGTCK